MLRGPPAGEASRLLAAHAPRRLRDRPADGPAPADLPGAGLRRRGRRPDPDRPLAPGYQQSHHLRLSAPVGRGRKDRPRRYGGIQQQGGRMSRRGTPAIPPGPRPLAGAAGPAGGPSPEGPANAQPNIDGFAVGGKGPAVAKPNRLEIDLEVSA